MGKQYYDIELRIKGWYWGNGKISIDEDSVVEGYIDYDYITGTISGTIDQGWLIFQLIIYEGKNLVFYSKTEKEHELLGFVVNEDDDYEDIISRVGKEYSEQGSLTILGKAEKSQVVEKGIKRIRDFYEI